VPRSVIAVALASVFAGGLAGCGASSGKQATKQSFAQTPIGAMRVCLRKHGYAVSPESAKVRGTAPKEFEFVAVWNLLNPDRIALALTISKTEAGAKRANAWTQKTNDRIGKGVVHAPVVRFGRVNVLWTTEPDPPDESAIYGCVRAAS
jgi:hypothetical protein